MIDPVSALSLVCNIVQVADYSLKIVAKGYESSRAIDGAITENRDAESCAKELLLRNQRLSESLNETKHSDDWDNDDEVIERLGRDCEDAARDLIDRLSTLRSYQGRFNFKSVRQALKAAFSKEEVESLAQRMKNFQEQINDRLLQSVSLRQRLMAVEQSAGFRGLDQGQQQMLDALRNIQLLFTSQLNSQTDLLLNTLASQHEQTQELLKALRPKDYTNLNRDGPDKSSIYQMVLQRDIRAIQALLRKHPDAVRSIDQNGREALHFAADIGDTELISYLLRKGANVNADDNEFVTPLHLAVKGKHFPAARLLLQKGADADAEDSSSLKPLNYAADSDELLWTLRYGYDINARDNSHNPALLHFARNGNATVVQSLLTQKADPELEAPGGHLPLIEAAQNGHLDTVELLLQGGADVNRTTSNKRRDTALGLASVHGQLPVVAKLLECGAHIDKMNSLHFTPLSEACNHSAVSVASLLIRKGADASIEDGDGYSPLNKASQHGLSSIVKELLTISRVQVDSRNRQNWTALHEASLYGYSEMAETLLHFSASAAIRNDPGQLPIHLAAEHGRTKVINLLLEKGKADVDARNGKGWTPLMLAIRQGHLESAGLLLNSSANAEALTESQFQGRLFTPLGIAAHFGHPEAARLLVEKSHVDINARAAGIGCTALMEAVLSSSADAVLELLSLGADPNITDLDATIFSGLRYPPICKAAQMRREDIVKILIEQGNADVNAHNFRDNWTVLHEASYWGLPSTVQLLLNRGADRNAKESVFNCTPAEILERGAKGDRPAMWREIVGILHAPESDKGY